jgi:tetratricopeptide (TPR) repeat protein
MSDAGKAVFLSYASQDAAAATKICEALRAAGVEVWFDQSELRGGDTWDAKIRRQIRECALFVPVISANTQARGEGYFRLEWKLAVDRSHLMADDAPFLFPVVIDDTPDGGARVPDKFREVQWTRLNVKDTPETLAVRVSKLLGGGVAEVGDRGRETGDRGQATGKRRQPAWAPVVWTVVGVVFALYYGLFPLWKSLRSHESKPPAEVPAAVEGGTKAATPPMSEARQLAARARAMSLDKYDSTAEDFAAAESLVKRALELDPNDAEVWAVSSHLNFSFVSRGFDHAPARTAAARSQAERALSLDPASIEGLYALGRWQRDNDDPAVAVATFKKIIERDPNHAGALSGLAWVYCLLDRVDESAALYERVAALPGPTNAALARYTEFLLYFYHGQFPEADRCIRLSVAAQPSANSQAMLAMLLLTWKGDADGAARVLGSGPTAIHNEPRTIWTTALVQLCQRAPEEALKTLDRFSDDYIQDNWFNGPKGYFVGRAHAQAGRMEAARLAWESGLAVVDARLKTLPNTRTLHLMRGELLAWLGQTNEALREARTAAELARSGQVAWFNSEARIYAVLGRADDALPLLEKFRAAPVGKFVGWPLTPGLLRLDPLWDKLRDDPRFQKLLVDAPATEAVEAPPRDWPKDPELKRAMTLLDSPEAISTDVSLAEDMVKGVLAVRPVDAEATTAMARVQSYYLLRGYDRTEERIALTKNYAQRAIALAPDEPEALEAMGTYLYQQGIELPRAEALFRRAIALTPQEPRVWRMLDNALFQDRTINRVDAMASALRTAERFPRDALVQYEMGRHYRDGGNLEKAEEYFQRAVDLGPVPNAVIGLARFRLFAHGDVAGMRALLDQVPEKYRGADRAVFTEFIYASVMGQPERGLEALRALPEAWVIDWDYAGPTSLLTAELLLMQGNKAELARLKFTEALAELGRHKVDISGNFSTTWLEPWILMRLGRMEEARARNAVDIAGYARPFRLNLGTNWWFSPIPANLLIGDRATALALIREARDFQYGRAIIRNAFHYDPRMAPWRDDAEINALLAEPAPATGAQKTGDRGQESGGTKAGGK